MKKISRLNKIKHGNRIFYNPSRDEKYVYYKVKNELEKKYGIHSSSRDLIIKQLISTLTDGDYTGYTVEKIDLFIIRSDIKNFYPSVNKHQLYKKIMGANILSDATLQILKQIFFSPSVSGIPLGLPFSSVLAEIYLEDFDKDIYQIFNPTFYFRYVDDLIIINYDNMKDIESAKRKLGSIFESNFLEINYEKTTFNSYQPSSSQGDPNELCFDYLGYNFMIRESKLVITISNNKYLKITSRIKSFFYFFKNSDRSDEQFWLLYYRLMNSLFGITSSDRNGRKVRFGIGYSYRFVNDEKQINDLLLMVRGLIHSYSSNSKQRSALLYLVFIEGSPLDILKKRYDYTRLTPNQIKKIKERLQITTPSMNISRIFYSIYKKVK